MAEMWWISGGYVVAKWLRYNGYVTEMWWLSVGDVVAKWRRCGG